MGQHQPLSSFDRKDLNQMAGRLLELPKALGQARAVLTRHRAEKRDVEREIKKRQTTIKRELADDDEYRELPNAAERNAFYDEVCQLDVSLEKSTDRLQQLQVAIDVAQNNVNTLEDERKALYGVLTAYHAAVMHEMHLDEAFAKAQLTGAVA
jgi:chromosome segregation ATPase